MRPDRHQRTIILQWLKAGVIDSKQLSELRPNPYEYCSDEELRKEKLRFAKVFGNHYCSRMKELGKCELYGRCKARQ